MLSWCALYLLYTYYVSRRTHARSGDAVTIGSIGTDTQVSAALAVVTCWTGLVAVKPCPACCTGALTWQRVAAERAKRGEIQEWFCEFAQPSSIHSLSNCIKYGHFHACLTSSVPECVFSLAGAVFVAEQSVQACGTEAVLAAGALKTLVAQTGSIDVVALSTVLAVTLVGTLWSIGTNWAFILASGLV